TPPLAVAIVAAALFLARLGAAPFLDPPEGIHAQIAWEMLRGAGFITPHLDGVPYFDKPPLLYWLMTGAFVWLGPTEIAARLVSGLAAVAVAVLTGLIGTRLGSVRVGLMAGLMVAANLEMFLFGRMVKPDLLFVACILLGLYGFILAYLGQGRWPLLLGYGGLGLAVLAKDFLGALGPIAIVALFLGLTGEGKAWRQWIPPRAVLLLLAVAVPWYVAVEVQHRGFLWYTIVDNHVLNLTRQRVFPDEDVPLSTLEFLAVTAAGFFPWVLALPLAVRRALARPWQTPEARLWALLAIWVVAILGVFALSPFKLPHYGLPAFPAMALLVARLWGEVIERPPGAPRSFTLLMPSLLAAAALAVTALLVWRGVIGLPTGAVGVADVAGRNMAAQGQPVATDFIGQFRPLFGSISLTFGLVAAALAVATWRRLPRLGVGAMLAGMLAFLPLSVEGLTLFAKSRSVRVMTDAVLLRAGPGDVVAHEGPLENSASALLRLDRRVQIVNGLQSNLAFGATFPEARDIFWDGPALVRAWRAERRVFLLTALATGRSVVRELPPEQVHLLLEGGGRRLYSNRP
ncbi:MAG TPA: glycosyltransferase family 39 protein, partial [Verrucomicrobiae bacterium]|nr:glycosyltransferase family 39 protein [Verrucomicrobiae bacterium]